MKDVSWVVFKMRLKEKGVGHIRSWEKLSGHRDLGSESETKKEAEDFGTLKELKGNQYI
jgi:hypothetical protein